MCDKAAEEVATSGCIIPWLEVDACDLTNYQHPPFLFTLWYVVLAVEGLVEVVKDLIEKMKGEGGGEGGDGGDGGGGGEDKGGDDKGDEGDDEEEGGGEEEKEEEPAEEEEGDEEEEGEEGEEG